MNRLSLDGLIAAAVPFAANSFDFRRSRRAIQKQTDLLTGIFDGDATPSSRARSKNGDGGVAAPASERFVVHIANLEYPGQPAPPREDCTSFLASEFLHACQVAKNAFLAS